MASPRLPRDLIASATPSRPKPQRILREPWRPRPRRNRRFGKNWSACCRAPAFPGTSALRSNMSIAITDSLSSVPFPSRCLSTRNRRNRERRQLLRTRARDRDDARWLSVAGHLRRRGPLRWCPLHAFQPAYHDWHRQFDGGGAARTFTIGSRCVTTDRMMQSEPRGCAA